MLHTIELLDAARKKAGIESDYRLAEVLGVTRSSVSAYRNGKMSPQGSVARKLAELAQFDADYVMVCMQAERTPDEARNFWEALADRLGKLPARSAAGALGAIMLAGLLSPTDANAALQSAQVATNFEPSTAIGLYIMSTRKRLRRLRQAFAARLRRFLPEPGPRHGMTMGTC